MRFLRKYHVHLILFLCVFTAFGMVKYRQYRWFCIANYDTGIYSNVAWNIAHGNGFHSAINKRNQLGEHFSPIVAAFAPLYWLKSTPMNLLLPQAIAVALAIVVFYQLARVLGEQLPDDERRWFVFTCTAMAILYKPVISALLYEFHPSTLGMPMLAGAVLCLHKRNHILFWVLVAALLTTKEVAILSVVSLALYAGLVLRQRRTMIALLVVAAVSATMIFGWLMPLFRGGRNWHHVSRLDFFIYPGLKLGYILLLALFLGITPIFGGRAIWAALPITLLNISVNVRNQYSIRFHYDDQNCVFWILAGMHGLLAIYGYLRANPSWARFKLRPQLALACLILVASFWGGGTRFIKYWNIAGPNRAVKRLHSQLAKYEKISPETGIVAQTNLGPYVCHRDRYVPLDESYMRNKPHRKGDYILLTNRYPEGKNYKIYFAALKSDPRLKMIQNTSYLTVFRVR